MTRLCSPKRMPSSQRISLTNRLKRHDLIENIEWLLRFNCGEAEILRMASKHPDALKTQLRRAGRAELIPRIFEHDQQTNERLGR